jgi:hypothetical protein
MFESVIKLTITNTGGTFGFSLLGGGATTTFANVAYNVLASDTTSGTTAATRGTWVFGTSGANSTVTNTLTGTNPIVYLRGSFTTTLGGTIIPSITWAGTLPGTSTFAAGSFITLTPIAASGTNQSGAWA